MILRWLVVGWLLLNSALVARADSSVTLIDYPVISELQTGTAESASQEFVELYNPSGAAVSLDQWTLEYKSATSIDQPSSWLKKATLSGFIQPGGFYLIAPLTYLAIADANLGSGLAGTGGTVRLKSADASIIDELGWGSANTSEGQPAVVPSAGQSLERLPGRLDDSAGNGTDTGNNSLDFIVRATSEPQSSQSSIEIGTAGLGSSGGQLPTGDPGNPPADDQTGDILAPAPTSYLPINITELLVNPASPQTDANDEFIELYNPNSNDVDLNGYTLKTGSNFHDYYILPAQTITAGSYAAFTSSQTHLSLTNSGGAAELLDPAGGVVDQTALYPAADEGLSWALINDEWQWTLQQTPSEENVLVALPEKAATSKPQVTKSSSKKKTTAKVTAAKVKKAASVKPKTTSKRATTKATATTTPPSNLVNATGVLPTKWLILGALALTMGYGLWEFRHDLQNYLQLARRYFRARRKDRPAA